MQYISQIEMDVPKFSLYENVKGNDKISDISIEELIDLIKNNPQKDLIQTYRSTGNDSIKKSLTTVTPHGTFNSGQKSDNQLSELSGLLFIDIDKVESNTKFILGQIPEVICFWDSVSSNGIHALAIIDGLNESNYKTNHIAYLNYLELVYGVIADSKVANLSTGLILSYDPNIYFNEEIQSLDSEELIDFQKEATTSNTNTEGVLGVMAYFSEEAKFQTKSRLNEYPQDCMHYPNGLPYIECFLPFDRNGNPQKIQSGSRFTVLSSYLNNLILLNPAKKDTDFVNFMLRLNKSYCQVPLPESEILSITHSKLKNRESLKPINQKIKKYWINPALDNKLEIFHKTRKDNTQTKIDEYFSDELMNETEKITLELISNRTDLGVRTIKRYLTPEMKAQIKEFNKNLKNSNTKKIYKSK